MKRYRNFDLELTDYEAGADGAEALWVKVAGSPVGEQRRQEAARVRLDAGVREACARMTRRELDLDGLIDLGAALAELLFPPAARGYWDRSRAALAEEEGLRLRLKIDHAALADLPWENAWLAPAGEAGAAASAARDASGFLALDPRLSIVRYELLGEPPGTLDPVPDRRLRLVAVMANAVAPELPPLELRREAAALRAALEERPEVELVVTPKGTLAALERELARGAHLFHFAGHGRFEPAMGATPGTVVGTGYLVFEDAAGGPKEVDAATLVVNLRGRGVRLAMLGACEGARRDGVNPWTGVAPALVRGGLPAVVAMQATLRDDSAIAFAGRCYELLAAGEPIDAAVHAGRLAVFNQGGPTERDWGTPVLYLRADSGVLFPRPAEGAVAALPPLGARGWVNVGLSGAVAAALVAAFYLAAPWIPDRWLARGSLSAAAVVAGAFAWLYWLAADDVRLALRRLLPRRRTSVGLGVALAALLATAGALQARRPSVLWVVPGIALSADLPDPGARQDAGYVYALRVWQGQRRGEPDWVIDDLRRTSCILGASRFVEDIAVERQQGWLHAQLTEYLQHELAGSFEKFGNAYLGPWLDAEPARPRRPGGVYRSRSPLVFELVKSDPAAAAPGEVVPLVDTRHRASGNLELSVLERKEP